MIDIVKPVIHLRLLRDGTLLLGTGKTQDARSLRDMLFGWHQPTFYGTTVDIRDGWLRLPPHMGIHYLTGEYAAMHAAVDWSEQAQVLRAAAPILAQLLENGLYMPDLDHWQKDGNAAWKPAGLQGNLKADYERLDEGLLASGISLAHWLSAAINALTVSRPDTQSAWDKLVAAYPQLQSADWHIAGRMEEADWLEAIGWSRNDLPFRLALQLLEPGSASSQRLSDSSGDDDCWRLEVALLDRASGERKMVCPPSRYTAELGSFVPANLHAPILEQLDRLSARVLSITPQLEHPDQPGTLLHRLGADEVWRYLTSDSLLLGSSGIAGLLPAWWDAARKRKPRLNAKVRSSVGSASSLLGLQQLVEFDWQLSVGDVQLTEEEFRSMVASGERLLRIRDQWIMLDPAAAAEIIALLRKSGRRQGMPLRDVLEMYLLGEGMDVEQEGASTHRDDTTERQAEDASAITLGVELNEALTDMLDGLRISGKLPQTEPPSGLRGKLRNYQAHGFSWLVFLRKLGLGGCLADDMGLGKTIQWIAYLQHLTVTEQPANPALLICPTSVLGNWQKELERFAPELRVRLHYGSARARGDDFADSIRDADVILTSYVTASLDEEELMSVEWCSLCLDEAQNIKNAHTRQASAVRKLQAGHRIALTGTPIENRLTELWSIFDFINPGYLGSLNGFRQAYIAPVEKNGDPEASQRVQRLIQPFLLRRTKKDPSIQLDLPDKIESKTYVPLTPEQAGMYERTLKEMLERIDSLSAMERRGLILATLTRLKQICDHPAIAHKDQASRGRIELSSKLQRLVEMVRELREEGDCCLVFTQFAEMGALLQETLERELGEPVQFLHGGTPKAARDRMVERFQSARSNPGGDSCAIFVLSLKAGGTGLNLTAANHVFHFDRWWNPAVENQATDRAFRIGQTRDVQVHKFISLGTIEERIDEMIERKLEMAHQIVGGGENWITELSTGDLRELFALRQTWSE